MLLILLKELNLEKVSDKLLYKNENDLYELNIQKAMVYIKVIQKRKQIDEQIINERKLKKKKGRKK